MTLILHLQQARQSGIKPATFQWLARSRLDLLGRLENLFADLQVRIVVSSLFFVLCALCFVLDR